MTTLALNAHFGEIDKYGNGLFYLIEAEDIDKVRRHVTGDRSPLRGQKIIVKLPHGITIDMVGLRYRLTLKLKYYKFTSRLETNKGESITGTKLSLIDMERLV